MNDFYSDVRARKALTYGSRYKKNGSKSKKCSLPSDGMTKKQWKERCGRVISFSFDKPISWKDFKELGKDTQAKYINNLMNKYGISCAEIAEMMGVCSGTVRRHIKENSLDVRLHKGGSISKANMGKWEDFVNGSATDDANAECVAETPEGTDSVTASVTKDSSVSQCLRSEKNTFVERVEKVQKQSKAIMRRFSMDFSGELRMEEISNSLLYVLGDSVCGTLHVEFDVEDKSGTIGFAQ